MFSGRGGPWARGLSIVLVLLSVALLAIDRARPEQSPFKGIKRIVADGTGPALTVLSAPFRALNQFSDGVASNINAAARVRELEQDNHNLLQWRDLALALHEKLVRYEELLGAPQAPTPIVVTARVISDSGGPFVRARLVNVGTNDGVAQGQAVLTHQGLIGRVMSAGKQVSRVLLLTDLNSRVPVFVVETGAHAILAGDNGTNPRLIYVARDERLAPGMRIVTSGEDGVLPRGLAVGQVLKNSGEDWQIALFARPEKVDFVSILEIPPILFVEGITDNETDDGAVQQSLPENTTSEAVIVYPQTGGQE